MGLTFGCSRDKTCFVLCSALRWWWWRVEGGGCSLHWLTAMCPCVSVCVCALHVREQSLKHIHWNTESLCEYSLLCRKASPLFPLPSCASLPFLHSLILSPSESWPFLPKHKNSQQLLSNLCCSAPLVPPFPSLSYPYPSSLPLPPSSVFSSDLLLAFFRPFFFSSGLLFFLKLFLHVILSSHYSFAHILTSLSCAPRHLSSSPFSQMLLPFYFCSANSHNSFPMYLS